MWTSPMMQLDLSRRRVAAISFLSNISVTELTDEQKSEQDNLHCLRVCKLFMKFCEIILPALEPKLEDLKFMSITPYLAQFFCFFGSKIGGISITYIPQTLIQYKYFDKINIWFEGNL